MIKSALNFHTLWHIKKSWSQECEKNEVKVIVRYFVVRCDAIANNRSIGLLEKLIFKEMQFH